MASFSMFLRSMVPCSTCIVSRWTARRQHRIAWPLSGMLGNLARCGQRTTHAVQLVSLGTHHCLYSSCLHPLLQAAGSHMSVAAAALPGCLPPCQAEPRAGSWLIGDCSIPATPACIAGPCKASPPAGNPLIRKCPARATSQTCTGLTWAWPEPQTLNPNHQRPPFACRPVMHSKPPPCPQWQASASPGTAAAATGPDTPAQPVRGPWTLGAVHQRHQQWHR